MVGDDEGVVVIPEQLVDEVAHDALEQEIAEEFIYDLILEGASVFDAYPMNDEMRARYRIWREGRNEEVR